MTARFILGVFLKQVIKIHHKMVRLKNWGLVSITIINLKIVNFIFAQTAVKKE